MLTLPIAAMALPGFMLGLFLSGRILKWVILVMSQAALLKENDTPIKATLLERRISWAVLLFHPVPLGLIAALVVAIDRWPWDLGVIARSFWFGVLLGGVSNIFLIAVFTLKLRRRKRALQRAAKSDSNP